MQIQICVYRNQAVNLSCMAVWYARAICQRFAMSRPTSSKVQRRLTITLAVSVALTVSSAYAFVVKRFPFDAVCLYMCVCACIYILVCVVKERLNVYVFFCLFKKNLPMLAFYAGTGQLLT